MLVEKYIQQTDQNKEQVWRDCKNAMNKRMAQLRKEREEQLKTFLTQFVMKLMKKIVFVLLLLLIIIEGFHSVHIKYLRSFQTNSIGIKSGD